MSPEDAICDIVTKVFPGSQCKNWRESAKDYYHFEFRLIAGAKVWGMNHVIPGEIVDAHPDAAAREIVQEIRTRMDQEMRDVQSARRLYQDAQVRDPWPGEAVEAIYEMGSAEPVMHISPFTGRPMQSTGYTSDGWFDTDQRRRDNQRLLELARIETERQEEEKAKASILDAIAKKAMRETN